MLETKEFKKIRRSVYIDRIKPFYHSKYIKVITGVRRCGKSEILNQIINDIQNDGVKFSQIIDIDLESEQYSGFTKGKQIFDVLHKKIVNKDKYYIFIDEIQHIKDFEIVIAAIRNTYNCSLFVTGSNSKLLHGKLQDRLTGRAKEFEIRPFVYSEALEFKKLNNLPITSNDFEDFVRWGGMPQRYEERSNEGTKDYLCGLFESIIQKDIFEKHKKINKLRFKKIAQFIMATSGKFFSGLSLAKYLKNELKHKDSKALSKSINQYADYLVESYLISECFCHDFGTKKALTGSRKFYPIDSGLKNSLISPVSYDKTFSLESIIYNELIYRGYKVHYAQNRTKEIDFMVTKNEKKCYIQVAWKIDSNETFEREYGALRYIKDGSPRYVISLSDIKDAYFGITHINAIDFLTNKIDVFLS